METGKFRKKKIYFTQVSNTALRDTNLSLKAKGLYALINSYITLEDFTLYKTTLLKNCAEGKKAFDAAWKELKDAGYLIQYRLQGEKGKFYYEYELLDEPQSIEMAEISQSIHIPKKEVVDNGGSGKRVTAKRGIYNNTNLNNTDLNNTNINNISSSAEEVEEEDKNSKDLKTIMSFCNNVNFKIKTIEIERLLVTYSLDKIIKAINSAISSSKQIENPYGYLTAILNNMEQPKNIVIENKTATPTKGKLSEPNFTQREYDYDKLEKQLLGWTDDEEDCEQVKNVKVENEIVEPVVETLDNSKIVEFMAKKIGSEVALKTWIIPNLTESKHEIIIDAENQFTKNTIKKRYLEFIKEYAAITGKKIVER